MGFLDRFKSDATSKPDALTLEVATRIHVLPDVDEVEMLDADTIAVAWSGRTEPTRVDISAHRQPWKRATGFERIEIIDSLVADLGPGPAPAAQPPPPAAAEPPGDWGVVFGAVLPLLATAGTAPAGTVRWPVGDLLEATAVTPAGSAVTETDCAQWGVAADQVRDAALANLVGLDAAPDPIGPGARAWVPTAPEARQSAWLAAPARLLDQLDLGSGIVLAPATDELVVVDPADGDLVRSVLDSTLAIIEQASDPLCPVPFLVTGDRVAVWEPPADDPAAPLVARARQLFDH